MDSPFQYGKTVSGQSFIDMVDYLESLRNNLSSGISTILISLRRWGKSSLVNKCITDNFKKRPLLQSGNAGSFYNKD